MRKSVITGNVRRIRREMAESMRNRNRVDDDSDLEDIVLKRMAADEQEFILMDWVNFMEKNDDK